MINYSEFIFLKNPTLSLYCLNYLQIIEQNILNNKKEVNKNLEDIRKRFIELFGIQYNHELIIKMNNISIFSICLQISISSSHLVPDNLPYELTI